MITKTDLIYENLALKLATNRKFYNSIREKLAINRLKMPLYNSKKYTEYLERGYRDVFELSRKGGEARDTWVLQD